MGATAADRNLQEMQINSCIGVYAEVITPP